MANRRTGTGGVGLDKVSAIILSIIINQNMIVRSISGLRFTLEELNYSFIQNYASAFHYYLPTGAIIIGRDGRPSGKQIEKLLCNVFAELDREVVLIGIVPTPTVQLYVESNHAAGGICITASHNPAD